MIQVYTRDGILVGELDEDHPCEVHTGNNGPYIVLKSRFKCSDICSVSCRHRKYGTFDELSIFTSHPYMRHEGYFVYKGTRFYFDVASECLSFLWGKEVEAQTTLATWLISTLV